VIKNKFIYYKKRKWKPASKKEHGGKNPTGLLAPRGGGGTGRHATASALP
jgi:hypothetical protein